MGKKVLSILFVVCLFFVDFQQSFSQEIIGPETGDLKDLIMLKINKIPPDAKDIKIICTEVPETQGWMIFKLFDNSLAIQVYSKTPQVFTFIVAYNLNEKTYLASKKVIIGTPIPPPEPENGKFGLIKASREGFAKVTSPNRLVEAPSLAEALRSFASKVASGAFPTPNAILTEVKTVTNNEVDKNAWSGWNASISPVLEKLYKDNKLATNADWAEAFNEIAKGLQ